MIIRIQRILLPLVLTGCLAAFSALVCHGQSNPANGSSMGNPPVPNQPGASPFDLNPPGNRNKTGINEDSLYAVKEIPSVKLSKKKYTLKRRLYQNMVTRYNFYYNAANKLEHAIQQVSAAHKDNFRELLSFYPYTLPEMSAVKSDLDSVIFKASIGIEVHDPRVKWMDNLYLLVGKAYYYEANFANAEKAFQFINLTYAPKSKEEYTAIIGSRTGENQSQVTVSTKEDQTGIMSRIRHRSSRNEALLWLVKAYTAEGQLDKAQSLLSVLHADPAFPARLQGALAETRAYFFFVQQRYKEATPFLETAIQKEDDNQQKARWEFILAQLALRNQQIPEAIQHFQHVSDYTSDPLMNFYAHFNIAQVNIAEGKGDIRQNTALLLKMARKNKYERYRGIIYYGLAELEMTVRDTSAATNYLLRSISNSNDDPIQKANAARSLADLYYSRQQYDLAKNYYDSTASLMGPDFPDSAIIRLRSNVLGEVIKQLTVIHREDSLQQLAAMPADQRDSVLRNILAEQEKKLKDQQRIRRKEEEMAQGMMNGSRQMNMQHNKNPALSGPLPGNSSGSQQGEWYFNNRGTMSAGQTSFRQKWGDRPLVDNWRRGAAIQGFSNNIIPADSSANSPGTAGNNAMSAPADSGLAALLEALPLTPQKMRTSNDAIISAYFNLGSTFSDELEDLPAAAEAFETLLQRFPENPYIAQVYYRLYILNLALQQPDKAAHYKSLLLQNFPQSTYAAVLQYGNTGNPDSVLRSRVMQYYDSTYQQYLTGDYTAALQQAQSVDSLFPRNYLKPKFDLLKAMLIVKTGQESNGKKALEAVIKQYPADSVKNAAQDILDALAHKEEIIAYLNSLKIDTATTAPPPAVVAQPVAQAAPAPIQALSGITKNPLSGMDSSKMHINPHQPVLPPKPVTPYFIGEKDPHFVIMLFRQPDKKILENANTSFLQYLKKHAADSSLSVSPYAITPEETMLVFRLFSNEEAALNFLDQVRADAPAVLPGLPSSRYDFYIISRDNFIMLNTTKDLQGYIKFFNDNYITQ